MKKEIKFYLVLFIMLSALAITCAENPFHPKKKSELIGNQPPETYLFLFVIPDTIFTQDTVSVLTDTGFVDSVFSDTTIKGLDTTASKQVLHWWGDDSDGQVIGYAVLMA